MAKKIKPVLPSLREKKRYVVFEIVSKKQIKSFSDVSELVWNSIIKFLGEIETANAGIWVLGEKWNSQKQRFMIKVNNKYADKLKASMALIKSYKKQKIILRSLGISGMIKKAEQYIAV